MTDCVDYVYGTYRMNFVTTLHLFGCNVSYRLQHVIGFALILRACRYMLLFKVYCFFNKINDTDLYAKLAMTYC